MKPTIYQFDGAPPSWRVRLGLVFKGIDAEVHSLSFAKKEHHEPAFKGLSPRATLPVLKTEAQVLRNSLAILVWLDQEYPAKPLFGEEPSQTTDIWQVVMDGYDFLREANRQLLSIVFAPDGPLENGSPETEALRLGAELTADECRMIEQRLSDGRPYLCGDRLTAADAVIFPEIRLLQRAIETRKDRMEVAGFQDLSHRYDNLSAWSDRLSSLPSVEKTLPAHWRKEQPCKDKKDFSR